MHPRAYELWENGRLACQHQPQCRRYVEERLKSSPTRQPWRNASAHQLHERDTGDITVLGRPVSPPAQFGTKPHSPLLLTYTKSTPYLSLFSSGISSERPLLRRILHHTGR